ncbi:MULTISPECIES: EAL domain-containing protein [Sulfurimonas]|uniref:EAL domain-containing protein n=1 Tax=Sulfurimonas TaxID=202746 RepID=UPI0012653882|nr:EAL domain-containing protein [Sulfurimonas indica]
MKIQKAIQNNLFTLYYQPKINLHTKKVESAEALIRLEGKDGIIMPSEFIPQAEESGEIIDIDRWVFNRLIEDSRYISMMAQDDITISFNVSSTHFRQDCFLENLENIFNFTTDFLSQFEIELTEYALIDDVQGTISKMNTLKEKGFKIAIDDFGTGYSSLLYLKDFPIDTIKIDKAFVDGIENDDEKTLKIIDSIIYLAKKLDLNVVAEGAESMKQVTWLYENQCDEVQGYYYSKPLPIDKFVKFVKAVNEIDDPNAYIVWSEKYSVNNYAFDTQHMIIASLLNKLYEELKNKDMAEKTDVNIYFSLLDRYIDIHFKAEEKFMSDMNYADIDAHINAHHEFKKLLKEFGTNLSLSSKKNSYDLFVILKEWFIRHELTMDKKFTTKFAMED